MTVRHQGYWRSNRRCLGTSVANSQFLGGTFRIHSAQLLPATHGGGSSRLLVNLPEGREFTGKRTHQIHKKNQEGSTPLAANTSQSPGADGCRGCVPAEVLTSQALDQQDSYKHLLDSHCVSSSLMRLRDQQENCPASKRCTRSPLYIAREFLLLALSHLSIPVPR